MKTCVIIPAYNEAKTIGGIITGLKERGLDVLVIDDGSFDDTGKIAARSGAILISHERNLGKGIAMREGFDFILQNTNYDTLVIMDGDGQHRVKDVGKFLEKARKERDDIIVGNRMGYTKNMPFARFITNRFMSSLLSTVCKQRIPDTQCGFRFLSRRVIKTIRLNSSNYDIESELLIKASRRGFKIASVPIETVYTGERSEINPVTDTVRFMILLIRSYFGKNNDRL